jgi:uncharacterized protein (TIGR02147 family)
MNHLYVASTYRAYLRDVLKKMKDSHGIKSKMAKALGCQNSHLTRVLSEDVHLSLDQAFEACSFLKLTEVEAEFFMKLVEHDRAGNPRYRQKLKAEMNRIKQDQEDLAKRFQGERVGNIEREMLYYSGWQWSAVHVATMIPQFRHAAKIARRLRLDELQVKLILQQLEAFGLVKVERGEWRPTTEHIHLPRASPMNAIQHQNWRARAVQKSQDAETSGLHYTIVQAIARNDFEKIKQVILDAIDRYRKIADPSKEEEIICFACDLFYA